MKLDYLCLVLYECTKDAIVCADEAEHSAARAKSHKARRVGLVGDCLGAEAEAALAVRGAEHAA